MSLVNNYDTLECIGTYLVPISTIYVCRIRM